MKIEKLQTCGDNEKRNIFMNFESVKHYSNGNYFYVTNKWSALCNFDRKVAGQFSGKINVSPLEIHINTSLLKEVQKGQRHLSSIEELFQHKEYTSCTQELWSQNKMYHLSSNNLNKHHILDTLKSNHLFKFLQNIGQLATEAPSITIFYHKNLNGPNIGARLKVTGQWSNYLKNPEFDGAAYFECVVKDEELSRWQHLFNTNYSNSSCTKFAIGLRKTDDLSIDADLDEIPLTPNSKLHKILLVKRNSPIMHLF